MRFARVGLIGVATIVGMTLLMLQLQQPSLQQSSSEKKLDAIEKQLEAIVRVLKTKDRVEKKFEIKPSQTTPISSTPVPPSTRGQAPSKPTYPSKSLPMENAVQGEQPNTVPPPIPPTYPSTRPF